MLKKSVSLIKTNIVEYVQRLEPRGGVTCEDPSFVRMTKMRIKSARSAKSA